MNPLSSVQFAKVTENEFAKLLTIGSLGQLEMAWPDTDDERRDLEAHLRERFDRTVAFQIKCSASLAHRFTARVLQIRFEEKLARVVDDPLFWYFFGHLDLEAMAFTDPVFLVPSREVHAHASRHVRGANVRFRFYGSMDPASRDRWRPFACSTKEVGERVMRILRETPEATAVGRLVAALPQPALWVGTPRENPGETASTRKHPDPNYV